MLIRYILLALLALSGSAFAQSLIKILPENVATVTGAANAHLSFDGKTETAWFPGWNGADHPCRAVVDLKGNYHLDRIEVLDMTGQPSLRFYVGSNPPATAKPFLSLPLTLYGLWHTVPVNAQARFVTVELDRIEGEGVAPEIRLFGRLIGGVDTVVVGPKDTVIVKPPTPPGISIKAGRYAGDGAKIGMDGFAWTPDTLVFCTFKRDFYDQGWIDKPGGLWVNPTWQANINMDVYLERMKRKGIVTVPAINKTPDWRLDGFVPHGYPNRDEVKLAKWLHRAEDPNAYADDAAFFFKIAARYGRVAHPAAALGIDTTLRWGVRNVERSGLDLLLYIEPGNEEEGWWRDSMARLDPEELAARMSAILDGHEGRMGPGYGIKTADPSMQVVLPGLWNLSWRYLDRMNRWFQINRTDKKFAADVLNVHWYINLSNRSDDAPPTWTVGCSPERDQLQKRLKELTDWRDRNTPGLPIFYSEFGWNTVNRNTNQGIVAYGGLTAEQIQANLICRTFVLSIEAGIDRCFVYTASDDGDVSNGGQWQSTGLAYSEFDPQHARRWKPKPAWYATRQLAAWLDSYTFAADRSNPVVMIKEFRKGSSRRLLYWSPTENGVQFEAEIMGRKVQVTEAVQMLEVTTRRRWFQPRPDVKMVVGAKAR